MAHSRKYGILIGIESYLDQANIRGARYAETDVAALKEALIGLGSREEDLVVLCGEKATKTTIEHHLERVRLALEDEDEFCFVFVGQGFSTAGSTLLACRDTQAADLAGTGIDFAALIKGFRASKGRKIQFFVDGARDEIDVDPSKRAIGSDVCKTDLDRELEQGENENLAYFFASRPWERSYASDALGQGIWAYHLTKVLRGERPEVLDKDGILKAGPLQIYLSEATAREIRETFTDRREQSPWFAAQAGGEFEVAELRPLLEKKQIEIVAKLNAVRDVVFSARENVPVRSLDGFAKPLKVPKIASGSSRSFVVKLAQGDLKKDLERMYSGIKQGMRYARKDLRVTNPDGSEEGSIWTPDFQYAVSVRQSEDDPTKVVFSRMLSEVRSESLIDDERFRAIFDGLFDTVRLTFSKAVEVVDIIDAIEERGGPEIEVEYPSDHAYCDLTVKGSPGSIRVDDHSFQLSLPGKCSLQGLIDAFSRTRETVRRSGVRENLALPDAGRR